MEQQQQQTNKKAKKSPEKVEKKHTICQKRDTQISDVHLHFGFGLKSSLIQVGVAKNIKVTDKL